MALGYLTPTLPTLVDANGRSTAGQIVVTIEAALARAEYLEREALRLLMVAEGSSARLHEDDQLGVFHLTPALQAASLSAQAARERQRAATSRLHLIPVSQRPEGYRRDEQGKGRS